MYIFYIYTHFQPRQEPCSALLNTNRYATNVEFTLQEFLCAQQASLAFSRTHTHTHTLLHAISHAHTHTYTLRLHPPRGRASDRLRTGVE